MITYVCVVCQHPREFPSAPSAHPVCCGKPMRGPVERAAA